MTIRRFDGAVALVTGASSGVGQAIALALAAEGACTGLGGRNQDALARTAAEIEGMGARVIAVPGDVRSDTDMASLVSQVEARFGGIDLAVHAAGVYLNSTLPEMSEKDWDIVMETNLKSCFLLARHVIPALQRRGGGAIVHLSSIGAYAADAGGSAYSASKAAVNALTRIMALDHASEGIRVNAVAPGNVRTPLLTSYAAEHYPDDPESMILAAGSRHPIGRLIEPDEVAAVVLFLLSEAASAITGVTYQVDGGWLGQAGGT